MSIKSCFGGLLSVGVVATLVIFGCGEGYEPPATYLVKVLSVGVGATGGGEYKKGDSVTIKAGTVSEGKRFRSWATASVGVVFADSTSATTAFRMPTNDVTVTANFVNTTYKVELLIRGASADVITMGGGNYSAGEMVFITTGKPPVGEQIKRWTTTSDGVTLVDETAATTAFVMPANPVTLTAVFGFIDTRDGKIYEAVTIGNHRWMAENLNYNSPSDSSWCYDNVEANCDKYGRLYERNILYTRTVCPTGWSLPYYETWMELSGDWGDTNTVGVRLKSTTDWNGTDDYGFSAMPGGYRENGNFTGINSTGRWWTMANAGMGGTIRIVVTMKSNREDLEILDINNNIIPFAFSVRCISN